MSRVKHLFAVVLAALMLCLLMPVAAFAEEASDGKMIVYAKLPSDWSDPHLWAWADDGTNAFDAWPGGEMEADSNNDGWYYCWIPETTNNIIINANDAAIQTSDYKLESKNAWVTVTDREDLAQVRQWKNHRLKLIPYFGQQSQRKPSRILLNIDCANVGSSSQIRILTILSPI